MKFTKFIKIVFLSVVFVFSVYAQNDSMPVYTAQCPDYAVESGETFTVKAVTESKDVSNITFYWSVSSGMLVKGQGTAEIEVKTAEGLKSITSTVETSGGFFDGIYKSCTTVIREKPKAYLLEEFNFSTNGYVKMILDSFYVELQNNPSAQGYIFIFPKANRNYVAIEKLIRAQIRLRRFDASRVTIVHGENNPSNHLQFWIVPAGAETPTPKFTEETQDQKSKKDSNK